jgi:hypothetical protein
VVKLSVKMDAYTANHVAGLCADNSYFAMGPDFSGPFY